jgi:predicted DNA-binding protein (UPF0251 family)
VPPAWLYVPMPEGSSSEAPLYCLLGMSGRPLLQLEAYRSGMLTPRTIRSPRFYRLWLNLPAIYPMWPGLPVGCISLRNKTTLRAIAKLPEEQRQVILLVGLEGMGYEEAAKILGIPVGTVRSRLSRGRDSLRALMDLKDEATDIAPKRAVNALSAAA